MRNDAAFNRIWYEGAPPRWWMWPLALLYAIVVLARRGLYRVRVLPAHHPGVPVIVIGNLVAGGAGKTPLAIALARELARHGFSPGIVSRGYGARVGKVPVQVTADTPVDQAGDEALLIARRTGAPVFIHPRRVRAARSLLAATSPDVLLCDDGLQHYALARDVEIVVVDGQRGLGNGWLLPLGPLRERPRRLRQVDHVIINGDLSIGAAASLPSESGRDFPRMHLKSSALINVASGERRAPHAFAQQRCVAVAGIGNPQRFFETLGELGYAAECRAFPDHHHYGPGDLAFAEDRPLLMTEKDAVKCRGFARASWWYLEIEAVLDADFKASLIDRVTQLANIRNRENRQ